LLSKSEKLLLLDFVFVLSFLFKEKEIFLFKNFCFDLDFVLTENPLFCLFEDLDDLV
jgi:hypothetical protein